MSREYEIDVRWRDVDAMGHVNNAVYFTYLEEARVRWTREILAANPGASAPGFIVASAKVDYRLPILLGDRVTVSIRVVWVGRSSFGFA